MLVARLTVKGRVLGDEHEGVLLRMSADCVTVLVKQ